MLSRVLALILCAAVPQESVTVTRAGKEPYMRHVPECERAASTLKSDPQAALELLDAILENTKIKHRECRIRWEIAPGTYSRYYNFFPYQLRSLALMNLASRSAPDRARTYLERALRDLQTSVDKGLESSSARLEEARKQLASLDVTETPPDPKPIPSIGPEWKKAIDAGRFVEAKRIVDASELPPAERKTFLERTDERCRLHADTAVRRFLDNLRAAGTPRQVRLMSAAAFDRDLALPDRADLLPSGLLTELLWCLEAHAALKSLRDGKEDLLEPLLAMTLKAVPLSASANFAGFFIAERFAYEMTRTRIAKAADDASSAPAESRKALRKDALALAVRWERFATDVQSAATGHEAFLKRIPARSFSAEIERFPVDLAVFDEILPEIMKSSTTNQPDAALAAAELKLKEWRAEGGRLSIDSRREIVLCQIVTGALRGLLAGGDPERIAATLGTLGATYRKLGGKAKETRFGPKVERIFELLLAD